MTFTPADTTDYKEVTTAVTQTISSFLSPPPPPVLVVGQQPVFRRKTNHKGKPTGKDVLAGFTLDFGTPLDPSTAANPANYRVNTVATKKLNKKVEHILHPIADFTVSYGEADDAVTIAFGSPQTFPTGGQDHGAERPHRRHPGGPLEGPTVFDISKGAKSIAPE